MYQSNNSFVFSPSDLTLYMDSPFASWMEHYVKVCPDDGPEIDEEDSLMGLLAKKGDEHEHEVLNELIDDGLSVVEIPQTGDRVKATIQAMEQGAEVIFQAALTKPPFKGYSDFLVKVQGESKLGDYHYEVWDTKLAKNMKPSFAVQLCCYEDMLQEVQGRRSDEVVVVLGNGEHKRLRTDDHYYYYLGLKEAFLNAHNTFSIDDQPDPADSTSWGHWEAHAKQLLEAADHLSQVATVTRSQIKKLQKVGITTMQVLVNTKISHVPGINPSVYQRLKDQARIQKSSVGKEIPEYEVLIPEEDDKKGLALLPPHSDLDVFFDIEGYPLDDGGLEYLWGITYFDENKQRQFKDYWAHDCEQEKQAFQSFIQWVCERWQRDPDMHIYHYANYEIAACRKLMGRYGVCEYEVDQLLRNEVFIDLYKVVRNGMLIGEPRYSIKNVEHLYRGKRETEVGDGGESVVVYERWRESGEGSTWQTSKILESIRDYNIDDCDSTQELVVWLRGRQIEHKITYLGKTELVEPEVPEEVTEKTQLRDKLLSKAEQIREQDAQQASLIENLAWFLEFHRRESKPVFWRLFDRLELTDVELMDDPDCLAGCERTKTKAFKPTPRARNLAYEYSFDTDQEFKSINTRSFYLAGCKDEEGKQLTATLVKDESDFPAGIVVLQAKEEMPSSISLVPNEYVNPDPIPGAIFDVVNQFARNKLKNCAILDFLQRKRPRIKGLQASKPIIGSQDSEKRIQEISKVIQNLDNSYLPIQGPPGTGKTYTGKQVIADLVKQGKKIGICSNSHKAINNLLIDTARFCQEQKIDAYFACTKDTDPEALEELGVTILKNPDLAKHIDEPCVIGTTAWGFARDDMAGTLDYLFIDEAGQVAVANLIAISRSAKNLVLMGDQMQLGQPSQGSHPAESGLSILDYLLHEQPTIPDDMGVFLGTTYRMHSAINDFISEAVYEGKLGSDPDNDNQVIKVPKNHDGPVNVDAGIIYFPVEHEGNTQSSEEEVDQILKLTRQLRGRVFTDKDGRDRKISWKDILYVAPYNLQVNALQEALGEKAKVGSVDKFQGQEAPIVILSMCASDASESPRGIDFLFDKHRLNVAVSRAQSLTIVVASPTLRKQQVNNIRQQNMLNMYCRLTMASS